MPLTPVALLEAEFPTVDRPELARLLLHHLRLLAVVEVWLDFAIGKGLELLSTRFDLADLGFSHQQSFAEGPCGFSAAHGRELRRIARLLPGLPALGQAFLAGLIPRTRLREVLSVATPETDAGWAQLARTMGTRPLARLVAAVKAGQQAAPTADALDPHEYERVGWLGTSADRSTWRFGLALVRQVAGIAGPEHVLAEALAAETLASVGPPDDDETDADPVAPHPQARTRSRQRRSARHRAPNARRLARLARRLRSALAKPRPAAPIDLPDWGACADAWEAVDLLLMLLRQRRSLDWERSRLLSWMDGRRLQQELGFGRFTDAAERLLGLAPREALRLVGLCRELSLLPVLDHAWREGRIATDALERLLRVVTPETEGEWAEFASLVSPKLVDAAIETVVTMDVPQPRPPWAIPLRGLLLDWQTWFGVARRRAEGSACAEGQTPDGPDGPDGPGQPEGACAEPGPAGVPLRPLAGYRLCRIGFNAPADVASLWRQALAAVRRDAGMPLSDADVVRRLTRHFLDVHVSEEVLKRARKHAAIERDGWCCVMPHCRSRGPFHEHHRQYRSAGGSDELTNLVTLCTACHRMIHAGKVIIRGQAPDDLTFVLGGREVWRGEVRAAAYAKWLARGRRSRRRPRATSCSAVPAASRTPPP